MVPRYLIAWGGGNSSSIGASWKLPRSNQRNQQIRVLPLDKVGICLACLPSYMAHLSIAMFIGTGNRT